MTPTCCHINAGGTPCTAAAMWRIYEHGTDAEGRDSGYTEACTAHVGDLLSHSGEPLPGVTPWYSVYEVR